MDAEYIKNLQCNDTVILYVPVCDEDYAGFLHGRLVKCRSCTPYFEPDGRATTTLAFSRDIKIESSEFFSSCRPNTMGCDLTSPLVFAEEEFMAVRGDEAKRKEFFKNYPRQPNEAFSVSESESKCWWQTKRELRRVLTLKDPKIIDLSAITIEEADSEEDDDDDEI